MASATQIPVSEYLQTTYRPDREYIDGEVLDVTDDVTGAEPPNLPRHTD